MFSWLIFGFRICGCRYTPSRHTAYGYWVLLGSHRAATAWRLWLCPPLRDHHHAGTKEVEKGTKCSMLDFTENVSCQQAKHPWTIKARVLYMKDILQQPCLPHIVIGLTTNPPTSKQNLFIPFKSPFPQFPMYIWYIGPKIKKSGINLIIIKSRWEMPSLFLWLCMYYSNSILEFQAPPPVQVNAVLVAIQVEMYLWLWHCIYCILYWIVF